MTCDEVREQLEAYVLDALDADERAAVEAHLPTCPECQSLVQDYLETAHAMSLALTAAAPLQPPATLKNRVLKAALARQTDVSDSPSPLLPFSCSPLLPHAPTPLRSRPLWTRWRTWGLAAAAILLLSLLAISAQLSIALAQERALRAEFANLVDQQEVVLEVIDSPKVVRRLLRTPAPTGNPLPPYGKVYTHPDFKHVVAMSARMPQPPAGQAYHLWLTLDGKQTLAGVMGVNDEGFALLVFDADRNGAAYESAVITLQPLGTNTPQAPPFLVWQATP